MEGILPFSLIYDSKIGPEVALLWFDRTSFIYELAKVKPFRLNLHSGLANTSHGPIWFIVFFVPNPNNSEIPFASTDCHINPFNPKHLSIFRDLARQSHWHVVLVDKEDKVVDLYEFNNNYKLNHTIDQIEEVYLDKETDVLFMDSDSFDAAKQEFYSKYTIDDLLKL